jgi:hypothetical protein
LVAPLVDALHTLTKHRTARVGLNQHTAPERYRQMDTSKDPGG